MHEVSTYGPRDLKRIFQITSDSTLKDWIKRGILPPPLMLNARVRRWNKPVIDSIVDGTGSRGPA